MRDAFTFDARFWWVSITPLGWPVVPEVYIMLHKSPGWIVGSSSLSLEILSFRSCSGVKIDFPYLSSACTCRPIRGPSGKNLAISSSERKIHTLASDSSRMDLKASRL